MFRGAAADITIIKPDAVRRSGDGLYTIGELAETFGLTHRSIRFYCEKKLITAVSDKGEARLFDRHNVQRLSLILKAKILGFSLRDITTLVVDHPPTGTGPAIVMTNERFTAEIVAMGRRQALIQKQLKAMLAHHRPTRAATRLAAAS